MIPISMPSQDGEQLKHAALSRLRFARAALVRRLQRAALEIALTGEQFTADAVRAAVPISTGINPVVVGAALSALAGEWLLIAVDYAKTRRRCAHARPLRVWQLADRNAALAWLAANPNYSPAD